LISAGNSLEFDADNLKGKYIRVPERSELPAEINEQLIVEYYSRYSNNQD
jgi:small subunit ribosomal protein S4